MGNDLKTLQYTFSHCAFCGKPLAENEGINGGVIYPEVWCNEICKQQWKAKRSVYYDPTS